MGCVAACSCPAVGGGISPAIMNHTRASILDFPATSITWGGGAAELRKLLSWREVKARAWQPLKIPMLNVAEEVALQSPSNNCGRCCKQSGHLRYLALAESHCGLSGLMGKRGCLLSDIQLSVILPPTPSPMGSGARLMRLPPW